MKNHQAFFTTIIFPIVLLVLLCAARPGFSANVTRPPKTLTDPQATNEAKSLMSFLVARLLHRGYYL